jgi:hypothetical protein
VDSSHIWLKGEKMIKGWREKLVCWFYGWLKEFRDISFFAVIVLWPVFLATFVIVDSYHPDIATVRIISSVLAIGATATLFITDEAVHRAKTRFKWLSVFE